MAKQRRYRRRLTTRKTVADVHHERFLADVRAGRIPNLSVSLYSPIITSRFPMPRMVMLTGVS